MEEAHETDALLASFEALGSPTRIALLHRLSRPAFMADLVDDLGLTRQSLSKHMSVLTQAGLVRAVDGQRGFLKAQQFVVDAAGLFAFKEAVQALAVPPPPAFVAPTRDGAAPAGARPAGHGLLLLRGDAPGRWFPLPPGASVVLGRDPNAEVPLAYDAYASARHAHLLHARGAWTLTDLSSRNGTLVNLQRLASGGAVQVRHGDVITVGRSMLLLRQGA